MLSNGITMSFVTESESIEYTDFFPSLFLAPAVLSTSFFLSQTNLFHNLPVCKERDPDKINGVGRLRLVFLLWMAFYQGALCWSKISGNTFQGSACKLLISKISSWFFFFLNHAKIERYSEVKLRLWVLVPNPHLFVISLFKAYNIPWFLKHRHKFGCI